MHRKKVIQNKSSERSKARPLNLSSRSKASQLPPANGHTNVWSSTAVPAVKFFRI